MQREYLRPPLSVAMSGRPVAGPDCRSQIEPTPSSRLAQTPRPRLLRVATSIWSSPAPTGDEPSTRGGLFYRLDCPYRHRRDPVLRGSAIRKAPVRHTPPASIPPHRTPQSRPWRALGSSPPRDTTETPNPDAAARGIQNLAAVSERGLKISGHPPGPRGFPE